MNSEIVRARASKFRERRFDFERPRRARADLREEIEKEIPRRLESRSIVLHLWISLLIAARFGDERLSRLRDS